MAQLTSNVGKNLKRLREAAGRTQEDVSSAAQACGIDWGRSTVGMLELGRYELKADELLLLPRVLHLAGIADLSLRALLVGDGDELRVTDVCSISGTELAKLIGRGQKASKVDWSPAETAGPEVGAAVSFSGTGSFSASGTVDPVMALAASGQLMDPGLFGLAFTRGLAGEAEAKAARKFDVPLAELVEAAVKKWGRSLTDQRDLLLRDAIEDDDVTPRTLQALRAHTTQKLLKELAGALAPNEED